MSETLARENPRMTQARPHERRAHAADSGHMKGALAQIDENLRQRHLPTIALALALGFVAARLVAPSR